MAALLRSGGDSPHYQSEGFLKSLWHNLTHHQKDGGGQENARHDKQDGDDDKKP